MTEDWNVEYQLVPPDMHRRNAAERAIRTFKAHFLAILAGVEADFPSHFWDLLLPQAELTLNLLRQSTINQEISAWEAFNGAFNYDATPLGPLGINAIVHSKPSRRKSWDFRGKDAWSLGVSMEHYRCQRVMPKDTRSERVSDTVEFRHNGITQPQLTAEDKVLHGINQLTAALKGVQTPTMDDQLHAIQALQDTIGNWSDKQPTPKAQEEAASPQPPRVMKSSKGRRLSPRVALQQTLEQPPN
jgi:hypothetical protein